MEDSAALSNDKIAAEEEKKKQAESPSKEDANKGWAKKTKKMKKQLWEEKRKLKEKRTPNAGMAAQFPYEPEVLGAMDIEEVWDFEKKRAVRREFKLKESDFPAL